ncbi:hypothetical protein OIU76_019436 [Salix suchowensis]|nr:hypothetical protein OIU76_019436 [Salix suchowensis]
MFKIHQERVTGDVASKNFFPEPSFKDLSSYRTALSQICPRLKDRLLSRSTETHELVTLRRESENPMKKCLTWWDLMWMSFGSVVGSGIFVITGQEARENAGPAIVLSYALSGFSALLSVFCYTEFAVEIPVAGGSFSYLRVELGDFIAYLAAGNILLEAVIGAAGAQIWYPIFRNGAEGVFKSAAVVYWAYTGFDMVATMAEETKNPSRDIPIGLVGSMSIITVVYCLMALALTGMVKYTEIDPNAAFSVAFAQIGMKWATYLVSICALKGMTTSLMVGSLGQGRYTTQIARSHMIPPCIFHQFGCVIECISLFSTLLIFMLLAVALLVRRYYVKDVISKNDSVTFFVCLFTIAGSSIGVAALWNSGVRGWIGYVVASVIWCSGTLGISLLHKNRVPKAWGVPLVPWLPSLSIAMNVFLLGSLGHVAFLRTQKKQRLKWVDEVSKNSAKVRRQGIGFGGSLNVVLDLCLNLAIDSRLGAEVFHRMISAAFWILESGRCLLYCCNIYLLVLPPKKN